MDNSPVTIATYWNPTEAHLARIRLEREGIKTLLQNEQTVTMNWLEFANATRGVELQVRECDVERAIAILDDSPKDAAESSTDENLDSEEVPDWEQAEPEEEAPPALGQWSDQTPRETPPTNQPVGAAEPTVVDFVPSNERERILHRAYRAAMLGMIFVPLEFYALYLLGISLLSNEPIGSRATRFGWIAAAICISIIGLLFAMTQLYRLHEMLEWTARVL